MSTYLLTWNPDKWRWADLQECVDKVRREGSFITTWSCGLSKGIVKGDRVFILRQGVEPRGIFGAGHAVSGVFEDSHWDEEKAAQGKTTRHIRVRFDTLLNPDAEAILPREWLGRGALARMHWNTQISGIEIPEGVAGALEREWATFLTTGGGSRFAVPLGPAGEGDDDAARRETTILRIVRDTMKAREIKLLYDFTCQMCGVRLESPAGPYAEAAHIRPLGAPHDGPDSTENLLCLCPNHHALFDLGGVTIADDLTLIGAAGRLTVHPRHRINAEHIRYHRESHPVRD